MFETKEALSLTDWTLERKCVQETEIPTAKTQNKAQVLAEFTQLRNATEYTDISS